MRLGLLVGIALAVRLLLALLPEVIEADGVFYGRLAQQVLTGEGTGGFHTVWPPLLPFGIAGVARGLHPGLSATLDGVARPELVTWAGRVFGALAGAFLVWPIQRMARRVAGERVAWVAAILVAFHPRLLEASTNVLTEIPFTLLMMSSLALVTTGRESRGTSALGGLAGGAAFLVRPEGLLWLPVGTWRCARGRSGVSGQRALAFAVVFAVVVAPYVAMVSTELGRVSIGAKRDYNLAVAFAGDFQEVPFDWTATRVTNLVGTEFRAGEAGAAFRPEPVPPFSLVRLVLRDPLQVLGHWFSNLPSGVTGVLSLAYPPFVLLSLCGVWVRRRSLSREEGLWGFLWMAFVGVYALVFVQRRMFLFLLPLLLIEAAAGAVWLTGRLSTATGRRRALAVLTGLAVLSGPVHATLSISDLRPELEQKAAGLWLRSVHPLQPGEAIVERPGVMARKPFAAWYGGLPVLALPDVSSDRLAEVARRRNARYVLVAERVLLDERPEYERLFEGDGTPPGLTIVRRWTERDEAILYETIPAEGNVASGSSGRLGTLPHEPVHDEE